MTRNPQPAPPRFAPLELVDVDGDRARFRATSLGDLIAVEYDQRDAQVASLDLHTARLSGWSSEVLLTLDDVRRLEAWCRDVRAAHGDRTGQGPRTIDLDARVLGGQPLHIALHSLGACRVCGHEIRPGSFAVGIPDHRPGFEGMVEGYAHEKCAEAHR